MEVVIGIFFLTLSYADFQFDSKKFTWRSYTAAEALPTTSRVELIDKKKFAKAALNKNSETFVMHIAGLKVPIVMPIHPLKTF